MLLRRALLLLPALPLACSSANDSQTHGPVVDSGADVPFDNPPDSSPDVASGDAAKEGGHKDGGRDAAQGEGGSPESSTDSGDGATRPCKGTIALAGGTSSVAFGATSVNGAAWKVDSLTTTSATGNPALVATSAGFMAMFTAAGTSTLQYSAYGASAWSPGANADGSSCATPAVASGLAALAVVGANVHSVYLGTDSKFYHGTYKSGAWDCESDPVSAGGVQSFGPSAPAAAGVGSTLVVAYDGSDGGLYTQEWTAGAWAAASPVTGAGVDSIPPTLVALTGGSNDLLLVYENKGDAKIYWAARASGTWSAPALTTASAYVAGSSTVPVSAAPIAAGGAVVAFLGTDGNAYAMTFDPKGSTWSTPVALLSGGQAVTTPPTVAAGVCGADAIAEVVQPAGVDLVSLSGGTWSSPTLVSGAAGVTAATIATLP